MNLSNLIRTVINKFIVRKSYPSSPMYVKFKIITLSNSSLVYFNQLFLLSTFSKNIFLLKLQEQNQNEDQMNVMARQLSAATSPVDLRYDFTFLKHYTWDKKYQILEYTTFRLQFYKVKQVAGKGLKIFRRREWDKELSETLREVLAIVKKSMVPFYE